MTEEQHAPAGWYHNTADPPDTERYWNGTQWTESIVTRSVATRQGDDPEREGLGLGVFLGAAVVGTATAVSWVIEADWPDRIDMGAGAGAFMALLLLGLGGLGLLSGLRTPPDTSRQRTLGLAAGATAAMVFALFALYGDEDSAGLGIFILAVPAFFVALGVARIGAYLGAMGAR